MKKCKDCVYNERKGSEFVCYIHGYYVTLYQEDIGECDDFEPKYLFKKVDGKWKRK